ncbi:MAG: F0F1 ATP synthase subunit B [Leptospiraceae bacterium]|nr:F0F1 ATP synthase subunit B [Leptospiraceae bacterium]
MMHLAAGGLNLLNVNPGLLLWTIVTFTIVMIILAKYAWGPIIHALDERAEKIHGDIDKAEKLRNEAETLLSQYKSKLDAARDEAIEIVNEAKSDATNLKNKMLAETTAEVNAIKANSVKEIELSKAKAIQDIQATVIDMSIQVASRILEKQLKPEDHINFVKDELTKLKAKG